MSPLPQPAPPLAAQREVKLLPEPEVSLDRQGAFEGYASLFGTPDLGRDVVMPGAFTDSLARRGASGIRMLWQHDPAQPIGRWLSLEEDGRGLKVRGRLNLAVERAREIAALMREGAIDGLSIGFRVERARKEKLTGLRRLEKLDLWEISVVTFPMLPDARISALKQAARPTPLAAAIRRAASRLAPNLNPLNIRGFAMHHLAAPETKSANVKSANAIVPPEQKGNSAEVAAAFEDFSRAFESFRDANDARLGEIETRLSSDVVTEEKLTRLDAALDEAKSRLDRITLERSRPALAPETGRAADPQLRQHKQAFDLYVRSGEASGLKTLEAKALSAGSGPDGGYLVPETVEREVLRRLATISPIRAIASVQTISSGQYKRAFSVAGAATGWVGETAARPQTAAPTLAELSFPAMELYAMPAATQTLLDDSIVNIDQWLASEVEAGFAEQEGAAFVHGDGINKPKGFLAADTVAEGAWAWGKLGFVATGADGAFAASDPGDTLIDLIYALKAGYRQNAVFVMNRKTESVVRKMKDLNGDYIWAPPAAAGQAATLLGFPVVEAEDMPDIAAGSTPIAFGDFRRGYLVVDRAGIRVLRDPYSAKPYVLFYTTKRVGGGIQDYDAIKLLKFGA